MSSTSRLEIIKGVGWGGGPKNKKFSFISLCVCDHEWPLTAKGLTLWYINCYLKQNDMIVEKHSIWHWNSVEIKGISAHPTSDLSPTHRRTECRNVFSCSSESPWTILEQSFHESDVKYNSILTTQNRIRVDNKISARRSNYRVCLSVSRASSYFNGCCWLLCRSAGRTGMPEQWRCRCPETVTAKCVTFFNRLPLCDIKVVKCKSTPARR